MWKAENWEFYKDPAHASGPMWMDDLHVEAIYRLCLECRFRSVLEVGCFDGFSTSALVQAQNEHCLGSIHCLDREIRPRLLLVRAKASGFFSVLPGDSRVALPLIPRCNLLVLDSDHTLPHTQTEWAAISKKGWQTIIAHDVGVTETHSPGPQWLRSHLQQTGWNMVVDEKQREGQHTHRGLMLATMDRKVFEAAVKVWGWLGTQT